ncbi:hypothetical protein RCG24_19520 [Neobacillus sp. OS1-32]|nr:hypothetical protein [Neobacillus sp. OS1-32]WML30061.1 hypothetical protein RCG24_19520 [Neobacillus sp. OS1-32]
MNRKAVALLMTLSLLTGAGGTYAGLHFFEKNKRDPQWKKPSFRKVFRLQLAEP